MTKVIADILAGGIMLGVAIASLFAVALHHAG